MHLLRIIAVVSVAFVLSTELFAFPAPVKHSLEQQEEQRLSQSSNGITKHSRSVQGFFEPNFERDVHKSLEEEHVNFDRSYDDNDQHVRGFLQPNIERDDDGLREHSTIERDLFESSRDDHIVSVPRSDDDAAFRKIFLTDPEKGKGKGVFQKAGKALSKVAKALKPGQKQKTLHRQAVDSWMANNLGGSADPPWQGSKRSVDVTALIPRGGSDDDDDKNSKTSSEFRQLLRTDSEKAKSKGKGVLQKAGNALPWKMLKKKKGGDLHEDLDTRGDSDDDDDDDDDSSSKKSSKGFLQTLNKVKAGFRDKKRGKKHGSDSSSSGKGIGSSSKPQPSRSSSKSSSSAKSTPAASPTASPEKSPPRPDDEIIKKVDEWKAGASKGLPPWTPRPWRHGKRALSSFSLSARDDDDDSSDSGSALRKLFGSPDGSKKGLLGSISGKAVKPILSHSDTYSPGGTPTDSSSHSNHSKKTKEKAVSPKKALQAVAAGPSFRHASYKRPSSVGNPSTSLMRPPQPVRLQSSSSFRLPRPNPILDPHAHNVAKIERWKAQALREGAEKPEPWQGAGQRDLPDEHLFKRFLNKMKKVVKGAKNVVKAAKSDTDSNKSGTPPARSAEVSPQSSPKKESQGTSQKAGTSSSTFQLRPGSPNTLRKVKTKVDNWRAGHGDTRHKPEDHWSPPPGYKTEHKDLYAPGSPDHGTAKDLYPHSDSEKRSNKVQFFVNEAGDPLPEHSKRDLNDAEHPAEENLEARLLGKMKDKIKGKGKKKKASKSQSSSSKSSKPPPKHAYDEAGGGSSTTTPEWLDQGTAQRGGYPSSSSSSAGSGAGPSSPPAWKPTSPRPKKKYFWQSSKKLKAQELAKKIEEWQGVHSDDEEKDDRRDLTGVKDKLQRIDWD